MLFLVPDEPDANAPSAKNGAGDKDFSQLESLKVELDLDDAPFLDEEETLPPPPPEQPAPKTPEPEQAEPEASPQQSFFVRKKKLIIIAAAGVLLLLVAGVAALFFLGGGEEDATAVIEEVPNENVIIVQVNGTQDTLADIPAPYAHLVELEPFIVPHMGSEGEVRFFRFVLALPLDEAIQVQEVEARLVELRGALYYYLSNRSLQFNTTEEEYLSFKQDLVSVMNEHLSAKKITDVYILESLVTGE